MNQEEFVKINFGSYDVGLFRYKGFSGLGNLLCIWGEAILYAKYNNLPVLWPTWPQLSLAAFRYKRIYLHHFKNDGSYIDGFARYKAIKDSILKKRNENIHVIGPKYIYNVDFEYGQKTTEEVTFIKNKLYSIVSPNLLERLKKIEKSSEFIGVHIRRGDFLLEANLRKDSKGLHINKAVNLEWYLQAILLARDCYGNLPVICISDAKPEELKLLYSLPKFTLQKENPLVDLLSLSKATGFIASGSTFSQWIAYLGQMQTWISKELSWCDSLHISSKLIRF